MARRKVGLEQTADLRMVRASGARQLAGMASQVQGKGKAAGDVQQPVRQAGRAFAQQEIRAWQGGNRTVAPLPHESAIEDDHAVGHGAAYGIFGGRR